MIRYSEGGGNVEAPGAGLTDAELTRRARTARGQAQAAAEALDALKRRHLAGQGAEASMVDLAAELGIKVGRLAAAISGRPRTFVLRDRREYGGGRGVRDHSQVVAAHPHLVAWW